MSKLIATIRNDPNLRECLQPNWQAIQKKHRKQIRLRKPGALTHSLDLDTCFKKSEPNEARWDYFTIIQRKRYEEIVCIEVHPATSGKHIQEMKKKTEWLKKKIAKYKSYPKRLFWLASGEIKILKVSALDLALIGIKKIESRTPPLDAD